MTRQEAILAVLYVYENLSHDDKWLSKAIVTLAALGVPDDEVRAAWRIETENRSGL